MMNLIMRQLAHPSRFHALKWRLWLWIRHGFPSAASLADFLRNKDLPYELTNSGLIEDMRREIAALETDGRHLRRRVQKLEAQVRCLGGVPE